MTYDISLSFPELINEMFVEKVCKISFVDPYPIMPLKIVWEEKLYLNKEFIYTLLGLYLL